MHLVWAVLWVGRRSGLSHFYQGQELTEIWKFMIYSLGLVETARWECWRQLLADSVVFDNWIGRNFLKQRIKVFIGFRSYPIQVKCSCNEPLSHIDTGGPVLSKSRRRAFPQLSAWKEYLSGSRVSSFTLAKLPASLSSVPPSSLFLTTSYHWPCLVCSLFH